MTNFPFNLDKHKKKSDIITRYLNIKLKRFFYGTCY
jgi:hypothetical protein